MKNPYRICLKMLGLILLLLGIFYGAEMLILELDAPKWVKLSLYIGVLGLGLYFGLREGGSPGGRSTHENGFDAISGGGGDGGDH